MRQRGAVCGGHYYKVWNFGQWYNLTGVTIKDHRKWKTVENQTFSTVFIFAQTAKIGISEHSAV